MYKDPESGRRHRRQKTGFDGRRSPTQVLGSFAYYCQTPLIDLGLLINSTFFQILGTYPTPTRTVYYPNYHIQGPPVLCKLDDSFPCVKKKQKLSQHS